MTKTKNKLQDDYSYFVYKSRYARWSDSEGRREEIEETVQRYLEFFDSHIKEHFPHAEKQFSEVREELGRAILAMECLPSMRAFMVAGKALERDHVAGYNCLAKHEKFLTDRGLRSFAETVGSTVYVLAGDGKFRAAEVKSFGAQLLQKVVLRPGRRTNVRHTVEVTANHRWLTLNRGEVTDLRVGDKLPFVPNSFPQVDEAFIRGFGFGDGTLDSRGRARVRLCGPKDSVHLPLFQKYGHSSICSPPSYKGDSVVTFHQGHFENWKELPIEHVGNLSYMHSWLQGYIAADGFVSKRQPGLASQNDEAVQFVKQVAPTCGFMVTGHTIQKSLETNYGTRKAPLQKLGLRKEGHFFVESIEVLDKVDEVFCVVEPVTKSFTLASGALTGNCAYLPIDRPRSFDETMYILLCGTGVGYSVEKKYVEKLPEIAETFHETESIIVVADSKIGWASSFRELIALLYSGKIPRWDLSRIRPAGARLKTFGGRASGPGPLDSLFDFTVGTFKRAAGRRLTTLEAHDLVCKIADVVVVGGVRRSALISLSDLSDERMRECKSGNWWETSPWRALANNSAVYEEKPELGVFIDEWKSLYQSKSGERGLFNREAASIQAAKSGRRDVSSVEYGTNPCSEILLRPRQFCNLSEVVIRPEDSLETLKKKVRLGTILGTIQSTLTDFRYLSKEWKTNCEEERLLGVSLTGICDHPLLSKPGPEMRGWLKELKNEAIKTNQEWASLLDINTSVAITCVKPSGTVSQLVDSSSGIHPRFSPYYIRTVRCDKKDPIAKLLRQSGVPVEDDLRSPESTDVFYFPRRSPEGSRCTKDVSAVEQLELWKEYQDNWCEHKPSCTVFVGEDEWLAVGDWVYRRFDCISGVSFLPRDGGTYRQAPYQEITEAEYEEKVKAFPKIDWQRLEEFEKEDLTIGSQEMACSSGACEL